MDLVAGFTAGCVTTLIMHPLDLLKVRMQVDVHHHGLGTIPRLFKSIISNGRQVPLPPSGSFGPANSRSSSANVLALYRGLGPNLLGNAISWSIYFTLYEYSVKTLLPTGWLGSTPATTYLVCSFGSGALTAFATNPIWVIKTRMLSTSRHDPGAYNTMADGFIRIWRHEGLRGFWKGFTPGLVGILQNAIQFAIYDSLKLHYRAALKGPSPLSSSSLSSSSEDVSVFQTEKKKLISDIRQKGSENPQIIDTILPSNQENGKMKSKARSDLTTIQYLVFSATSKLSATILTYPYQVVRTRMQIHHAQSGSPFHVLAHICKSEGLSALYKGLTANLLRVVPATCTTLLVYETVRAWET